MTNQNQVTVYHRWIDELPARDLHLMLWLVSVCERSSNIAPGNITELAGAMGWGRQSTMDSLDRLESVGLISRSGHPKNKIIAVAIRYFGPEV